MTASPRLVIFDCDGVLVDSEPIACRTTAETMTELGIPTTAEEAHLLFLGDTLANVIRGIEARATRPLPDGWPERMQENFWAELRRSLQPMPGAAEAVQAVLGAGLLACVASQGAMAKMELTLGVTGLWPLFEGRVFSATMVARPKPFPDLFLYAAAQCGVDADRAVVVEDSPKGVQAAVAAGMRALGYARSVPGEILSEAGAEVLHDLRDVPKLLGVA
ncbi:MAG TPA: HAD family hydrolase [Polyangiaceae bacterium]|nr:HAD family hydrolase [Polyangiaceae bacterium]